jgi:hypothetical protein
MSLEEKYWDYVLEHRPESYVCKDVMIGNWDRGLFFDEFAESLGMTEDQLIEEIENE